MAIQWDLCFGTFKPPRGYSLQSSSKQFPQPAESTRRVYPCSKKALNLRAHQEGHVALRSVGIYQRRRYILPAERTASESVLGLPDYYPVTVQCPSPRCAALFIRI